MKCEHINTIVKSSRDPFFVAKNKVTPILGKTIYPCLVVRRRHCLDCGYRFDTIETTKEFMNDIIQKANYSRSVIIRDMIKYLEGESAE